MKKLIIMLSKISLTQKYHMISFVYGILKIIYSSREKNASYHGDEVVCGGKIEILITRFIFSSLG